MTMEKKSLLQSIPLGAKLLIGFLLLSVGVAMLGGSEAPVETGLWIFIGVVVTSALALVIFALIISFRKRPGSKKTEDKPAERRPETTDEAPAPPAPHPPAPAGGHGHGGHGGASGALGWLLLAIVLGILALVYVGKKAGFGVIPGVGEYATSVSRAGQVEAPPPLRSAQWTWVYVDVPPRGNDWHTVPTLPGLMIQYCAARTDENCTDKEPKGFRVKCTDSSGEVREWPEICPIGDDISWQSATSKPFRVKWRDKRN